jgi:hypothetical protein
MDTKVLVLIEKVNKNYRLPLKRLYGRKVFKNQEEVLNEISFPRFLKQVDSKIWRLHLLCRLSTL